MRHHRLGPRFLPCVLAGALLCDAIKLAAEPGSAPAALKSNVLANTQWRLVEYQSMDDAQGTQRPDTPSRYVLRLDADGVATIWLNCNRVTGTWLAHPVGPAAGRDAGGRFEFGQMPSRAADCPTPGMERSMLRQLPNVRSFTLKQGRLHLGLIADRGVYVWSRDSTAAAATPTAPKQAPEKPAARTNAEAWQVTRRVNLREQPSTQSRVLMVLNAGTRLARGACQAAEGREWCRVAVQSGGEGFVAAEYLRPMRVGDPPK